MTHQGRTFARRAIWALPVWAALLFFGTLTHQPDPQTAFAEEYRRDSPLHNAEAVRTSVLLMQGTEDFLPVKLVRDFRKTIEAIETPVELLVFKNEGHSLTLPSSKLFAAQQQIAWFRTYLSPQ